MEYGIQLYSVRDLTGTDMAGALSALKSQGYSSVEFAGFFGHQAEDIVRLLGEQGLKVSGTHTGLDELVRDIEGALAYHKAIGNRRIIIPYADLSCQEKIDAFIAAVASLLPHIEKSGMRLGFHNHDKEFLPNPDGSVAFEQLIYRTELDLEIDTFWAYAAGINPVALMKRLSSRVPVIHIKDGYDNGEGMPLGQGTAPVKAVYETAKALGISLVVESETLTPDGLSEAGICINYLRTLEG